GKFQLPSCSPQGYTGESNNLYFLQAGSGPNSGSSPALVFTESSTASATTPCQSAVVIGASVAYTYCIGEYRDIVGGGCQSNPQQYWDCWHNSQDFSLGEGVCHSKQFSFFKTKRTQYPVGGDDCGYSYGLMYCFQTASPDMPCSN